MKRATEKTVRPAQARVAAWARRYFTDPRAREAYLRRVERRTGEGKR
ncbi:hypothetical protein [Streptomyces sp. NPDC056982]